MSARTAALVLMLGLLLPAPSWAGSTKVGAAYHMIGQDYHQDQFLRRYHDPAVRATVQQHLRDMARGGATMVRTRIWSVIDEADNGSTWASFPLSAQELVNVRQYALDVRAVGMEPWLTLLYLWCADYSAVNADGTVGACHYSWEEWVRRTKQTILTLADAVAGIVPLIELNGELLVSHRPNEERMLLDTWPYFEATLRARGITPSIYFVAGLDEALFDPWIDPRYPELNNHGSMFWVYRATKFMADQGWVLPSRLEVSSYFHPIKRTPAEWAERILADFVALHPGRTMGVAEMFYDADHGRAWVRAFQRRGWPVVLSFWPMRPGGDPSVTLMPPFAFGPYLPKAPRSWWRYRR